MPFGAASNIGGRGEWRKATERRKVILEHQTSDGRLTARIRMTRSFHLSTSTPLARNHTVSTSTAIGAGISSRSHEYAGASTRVKFLTTNATPTSPNSTPIK